MKKMYKKIIVFSFVIICLCGGITTVSTINSTAYAVNSNMDSLMNEIDKSIEKKDDLSFSSNPYDYILSNERYNRIIKLGVKALPILADGIQNSKKAGLKEYIMACAIQDISGAKISEIEGEWSNSREFIAKYVSMLNNVENSINAIIISDNATDSEKVGMVKKYGVFAIPFLSKIAKSNKNYGVSTKAISLIEKDYLGKTGLQLESESEVEDSFEITKES